MHSIQSCGNCDRSATAPLEKCQLQYVSATVARFCDILWDMKVKVSRVRCVNMVCQCKLMQAHGFSFSPWIMFSIFWYCFFYNGMHLKTPNGCSLLWPWYCTASKGSLILDRAWVPAAQTVSLNFYKHNDAICMHNHACIIMRYTYVSK